MVTGEPPRRIAFPVIALVVVAVNLPQSVVVPILPSLRDSYGTDQVTATWMITGFLLSSGVATPLLGRLGDTYGPRRILTVALLVLALGSVGAALAPSVGWAITMRVVQGVSGGAVPVAFSALRQVLPVDRFGNGVTVLATVGSIAFSLGIVAAGPMLESWGRMSVFLLPGGVALVALFGVWLAMPADRPARGSVARFGVLPVALLSATLVLLLLAISQSSRQGWNSPLILSLCGGALLSGLTWIDRERRAAVPFVDLGMMRARGVWTANVVALLAGAGMFGCAVALPQLLQAPDSAGGLAAGLDLVGILMAPIAGAAFLTSLCVGRLLRAFSTRALILAGGVLSAVSFAGMAVRHDESGAIVAWCVVQGVGNGLILSTVAVVVVGAVPAHQTGVVSGMNTNIRTIGGSVGAALTAAIITAGEVAGEPTEPGFVAAFLALAASMAVATVAALMVPVWQTGRPAPGRASLRHDNVAGGVP